MQDISRGDISIANAREVDFHHTANNMNSSINSKHDLNLTKQLNAEENVQFDGSNAIDLFPSHTTTWQQHPMNTNRELGQYRLSIRHHDRLDHNNTKLLLQGSDDPLISHGANSMLSHDDEHPGDFAKCLMAAYSNQHNYNGLHNQEILSIKNTANFPEQQTQHRPTKSGCSNLTKQQLKVKANLMSARNHKQNRITPPPTTSGNQKQHNNLRTKKKSDNSVKLKFHHQALPPEYLSHFEATQDQVRTVKGQSNTTQQRTSSKITNNPHKQSQPRNSHENVRSWLQKIAEIQRTANAAKEEINQQQKTNETQKISNNFHLDANNNHHSHMQNLPYMGKITLDNCKSRRGRKPKKADICHMIYKNYGTVIPTKSTQTQDYPLHTNATISIKTDEIKTDVDEQPLNLCLRDQTTDSYSISSGDEITEMDSNCPTPLTTTSDCVRDAMLANNLKNSLDNLNELQQQNDKFNGQIMRNPTPSNEVVPTTTTTTTTTENLLHPVTMYYKKLLQSGVLLSNINGPFETIQKDNQLALKIPLPSGFFSTNKMVKPTSSTAAPTLEYTEHLTTPFTINSDSSTNQQDLAPKNR